MIPSEASREEWELAKYIILAGVYYDLLSFGEGKIAPSVISFFAD